MLRVYLWFLHAEENFLLLFLEAA